MKNIRVIAFDADDTLWVNEPNYRKTEDRFCELLSGYMPAESVSEELFKTEMENLPVYGYGAKGFMLSMIETLIRVSDGKAGLELIDQVISLGKELLKKPVEVMEGVRDVLERLNGNYRLVLATKGDLLDQERKLSWSGLQEHFHHIEIMSEKNTRGYRKLLRNIDCEPECFLMVGNSLKSDVIPVLELGGYAVHVPYHINWAHELVDQEIDNPRFLEAKNISELLKILQ